MTDQLIKYHKEYEKILHSDAPEAVKDKNYAFLMTDMEEEFNIPMIRDEAWERKNRKVIALFRKISKSRNL